MKVRIESSAYVTLSEARDIVRCVLRWYLSTLIKYMLSSLPKLQDSIKLITKP